ncbi:MAG: ROK family protein, partial [Nitrospiraceae bacterium]
MKIALGIDIGGTNTKMVLASEQGEILLRDQSPTPSATGTAREDFLSQLVDNVQTFMNSGEAKKVVSGSGEMC